MSFGLLMALSAVPPVFFGATLAAVFQSVVLGPFLWIPIDWLKFTALGSVAGALAGTVLFMLGFQFIFSLAGNIPAAFLLGVIVAVVALLSLGFGVAIGQGWVLRRADLPVKHWLWVVGGVNVAAGFVLFLTPFLANGPTSSNSNFFLSWVVGSGIAGWLVMGLVVGWVTGTLLLPLLRRGPVPAYIR